MTKKQKSKLKIQADDIIAEVVLGRELRLDWLEREIEWHTEHSEKVTSSYAQGFIKGLEQARMIMTAPLHGLCKEKRYGNKK